jgi:drug/metabolite transporter (DMT)-like permease
VFYALSAIYGRRFSRAGLTPLASAAGQITSAAVIMVPLALLIDRPWNFAMPGPGVWAALVALAAISTTLAYIIYYRVLATAGAANLMLVTLLTPVGAIILGAIFLGERLSAADYTGLAVIALGLALIDGRVLRIFRRPVQA